MQATRRMTNEYDISGETLVGLKEGHKLPRNPAPSYGQLNHWISKGVIVKPHPDRPVVILESLQDGADVYTSVEAYIRFRDTINAYRQEGIRLRAQRRAKERL